METKFIYLHGFNSSAQGRTAQELSKYYGDNLIAINYDYIDASRAHQQIVAAAAPYHQNDKLLFIGTSLGGFWANYFAQFYRQKCVLFNPALRPSVSLRKYIGENTNFNTGEKRCLTLQDCDRYNFYESIIDKTIIRTSLLGINDTTIPYQETSAMLEGTVVILTNDGHRIGNVQDLISEIDRLARFDSSNR